jgi:lipoprotein-anchoring transpeptidase ErfK/SrfK
VLDVEEVRVPLWQKLATSRPPRFLKEGAMTHLIWRQILAFVSFLGLCAPAYAQAPSLFRFSVPELSIEEEPGRIASDDEVLPSTYRRQLVFFRTTERPGTIVVHTSQRYLYIVQGDNRAIRYGIGVGREGFQWAGLLTISRKAEWPDWTPPAEMITRQPYLPRWMAGGPGNPLGARALYLGSTIYRIHGTNQPQTIGHAVSSGCFRLTNTDVSDLYERVPVGTRVVVRHAPNL